MKIICPDCQFTREVALEDLPSKTVIANCPSCGCRFRFSPTAGVLERLSHGSKQEEADDPLPEGAIVVNDPASQDKMSQEEGEGRELERLKESEAAPRSKQEEPRGEASPLFPLSWSTLTKGRGNPWDKAPGRIGWFASFYQTVIRVMFTAPRFFSSLSPTFRTTAALSFYILISLFEFCVNSAWVEIFRAVIADSQDPQLTQLLALLAPQGNFGLMLLFQIAFATLKLYLMSSLFFLVYRVICPQRATFALIFQVVAYSTAPAVLAIVPIAGSLCGALWSLACLAVGLRHTLEISWMQALLGLLPVALLLAVCTRLLVTI